MVDREYRLTAVPEFNPESVSENIGFSRKNALKRIGLGVVAGILRMPAVSTSFVRTFLAGAAGGFLNTEAEKVLGESIHLSGQSAGVSGVALGVAAYAFSKFFQEIGSVAQTGQPFWKREERKEGK